METDARAYEDLPGNTHCLEIDYPEGHTYLASFDTEWTGIMRRGVLWFSADDLSDVEADRIGEAIERGTYAGTVEDGGRRIGWRVLDVERTKADLIRLEVGDNGDN